MLKSLLFVILALQSGCCDSDISLVCPGRSCNCSCNSLSEVVAVCRVNDLKDLENEISVPGRIRSLKLSIPHIKTIENGAFVRFTNLVHLSLARNRISEISSKAFEGLFKLTTLNLGMNNLDNWNSELTNQLPSLQKIDVTGNKNWTTPEHVLKLKNLQEVEGLYLNDNCQNCQILTRNRILKKFHGLGLKTITNETFTIEMDCFQKKFCLNNSYNFLTETNLFPACTLVNKQCQKSLGLTTETNRCFKITKTLLIAAIPIGIVAVVLNFSVVVITLSSKHLRQHPYLILVSFLAIGDTVAGIYCTVVASLYQLIPLVEMETKRKDFCPFLGSMVLFAEIVIMNMSFLLTVERFLSTVFWYKRNLRMTMKHVLLATSTTVATCFAFAIWGLIDLGLNTFGFSGYACIPVADFKYKTYRVHTMFIVVSPIFFYLTTIVLYTCIFIVVRRSSRQIGIAREARLAKRIGTLVLTNFVFLFLPISIYVVVMATGSLAGSSAEQSLAISLVCLIILPGINSILNPILYGYRNDMILRNLRSRVNRLPQPAKTSMRRERLRLSSPSPAITLSYIKNDQTSNTSGMTTDQNRERNETVQVNMAWR